MTNILSPAVPVSRRGASPASRTGDLPVPLASDGDIGVRLREGTPTRLRVHLTEDASASVGDEGAP